MPIKAVKTTHTATFWMVGYLALLLAPVAVLLLRPTPAKNGFLWELGIGLGFAALGLILMQFLMSARLRAPTAPFGMDMIYYFHRLLSYGLLSIVLAHPALLVLSNPAVLTEFSLQSLSWAVGSGILALTLILLIVISSLFRQQLGTAYHHWRALHLIFAVTAAALAFVHLRQIDYYSADSMIGTFWLLFGLGTVAVLLYSRLLRPWLVRLKPWRVTDVQQEAGDCWTLTLAPDGHSGMDFRAGQFAWLNLGHSPFAMQEHPFSMASAPQENNNIQFTIKELGDFTSRIGNTEIGSTAWIDGPHGVFCCDDYPDAPGFIFIGGGIGIAPVFSLLKSLAQQSDSRSHVLFAAHSQWDRIPRRDEIVAVAKQLQLHTVPILETPPANWQGEQGRITTEVLQRHLPNNFPEYHYFMCGPQPMLDAVIPLLIRLGVPWSHIHLEFFEMA